MNQQKFLLLIGVVIGLAVVVFFGGESNISSLKDTKEAKQLYPGLKASLNKVTKLEIKKGAVVTTLLNNGGKWVVKEKSHYAANTNKIRQLMNHLSTLYLIERKTTKPENFARLGVDDANGINVSLRTEDDKVLASLIIGKTPTSVKGRFLRTAGENQVWLTDQELDVTAASKDWINDNLFSVASNHIQSIKRRQGDTSFSLITENNKLKLAQLPEGKKAGADYLYTAIQGSLTDLKALDVKPASDLTWDDAVVSEYNVEGGWLYKADVVSIDDKSFVRFDVSYDGDDEKSKEKLSKLKSLTAWAFEVASYKTEGLKRMLDELVEDDKPAEEPAG